MKNNKLFSILLALLVCLSMVVSASATENELSFTLESDSSVEALDAAVVNVGETVTVLVNIESNPGILGAIFSISYDSSVLTLTAASNGVTAEGVKYTAPSRFKDPTTFVYDAMDPTWTEDGKILTLTFRISADAAKGEYAVTLSYDPYDIFDANGDPIYFAVADATITVK